VYLALRGLGHITQTEVAFSESDISLAEFFDNGHSFEIKNPHYHKTLIGGIVYSGKEEALFLNNEKKKFYNNEKILRYLYYYFGLNNEEFRNSFYLFKE
jgi:hypothetical protein